MPRICTILLVACVASPAGCDNDARRDAAVATPEQRFAAEGLTITEMSNGRMLWRGTVARAAGDDLETATIEQVSLRRESRRAGEPALTIDAPRGALRLAEGRARFDAVRIRDDAGHFEITAHRATYVEADGQITAAGPVEVRAPGLHLRAESGVLRLGDGRLDLAGPVRGRWEPGGR